jgi:hypothetical protein
VRKKINEGEEMEEADKESTGHIWTSKKVYSHQGIEPQFYLSNHPRNCKHLYVQYPVDFTVDKRLFDVLTL